MCWTILTFVHKENNPPVGLQLIELVASYSTLTSKSISGCTMTGQIAAGLTSPDLEVPASSADVK